MPRVASALEVEFMFQVKHAGLPPFERDYQFAKDEGRKYELDLAWPERKLGVEVQGGIWRKGGHSSGQGISRDCDKMSLAASLGWLVLPVTREMIKSGAALQYLERALRWREAA